MVMNGKSINKSSVETTLQRIGRTPNEIVIDGVTAKEGKLKHVNLRLAE
jgi:hypothetical protein